MRTSLFILLGTGLLAGCGTSGAIHGTRTDFSVRDATPPHVGEAQILARRAHPMRPLAGDTGDATPRHVGLANGGSLLLWTEGDVEWGRRAMAQSFGPDGAPRTSPFVLSSREMDVFGEPAGSTSDGHRVVATFRAAEGGAFEIVAVPVEGL